MEKIQEVINDYETSSISLDQLQEYLWGLSESSLEKIPEEKLDYYLHLQVYL